MDDKAQEIIEYLKKVDMPGEDMNALSGMVLDLLTECKESSLHEESKKVQFLVMFKNKALMCVRAEREMAQMAYAAWQTYREKPDRENDGFLTIGDWEEEIMGFVLSDVSCIKILFSQRDVGVTG